MDASHRHTNRVDRTSGRLTMSKTAVYQELQGPARRHVVVVHRFLYPAASKSGLSQKWRRQDAVPTPGDHGQL